ncbi:MAG: hypothetical protein ACRD12_07235 [Acidimicrobiales bacterium]
MLAVFAFARLVTAIPLTPGGVGVMELALIGGLVTAGGERAAVVAAVLSIACSPTSCPSPSASSRT